MGIVSSDSSAAASIMFFRQPMFTWLQVFVKWKYGRMKKDEQILQEKVTDELYT